MKFGKIYSDATSLTNEERADKGIKLREVEPNPAQVSPAEQAFQAQTILDWKSNPVTSALLKDLGSQIEESINEAIKLSVGYSSHQNPYRIIQLLNKAYELKQIIHRYGRN